MAVGLEEREKLKGALGKFVNPEIAEKAMKVLRGTFPNPLIASLKPSPVFAQADKSTLYQRDISLMIGKLAIMRTIPGRTVINAIEAEETVGDLKRIEKIAVSATMHALNKTTSK